MLTNAVHLNWIYFCTCTRAWKHLSHLNIPKIWIQLGQLQLSFVTPWKLWRRARRAWQDRTDKMSVIYLKLVKQRFFCNSVLHVLSFLINETLIVNWFVLPLSTWQWHCRPNRSVSDFFVDIRAAPKSVEQPQWNKWESHDHAQFILWMVLKENLMLCYYTHSLAFLNSWYTLDNLFSINWACIDENLDKFLILQHLSFFVFLLASAFRYQARDCFRHYVHCTRPHQLQMR